MILQRLEANCAGVAAAIPGATLLPCGCHCHLRCNRLYGVLATPFHPVLILPLLNWRLNVRSTAITVILDDDCCIHFLLDVSLQGGAMTSFALRYSIQKIATA